jgi:transcriptional regulator with XRE-family HTH domain
MKWMDSIQNWTGFEFREQRKQFGLNLICFAACIEGLFFVAAFCARRGGCIGSATIKGEEAMDRQIYTNAVLDAVEETAVDALIESKAIGQKIRRLRLKRSMGLVELGRQTGLSASFLSQLETGRVVPTLRNLARITMVFGKDFSYFFREGNATTFHISREKNRIRLPLGKKENPFLISESMSALIPDRSVVPCIAEFLPGIENAAFDPQLFEGLELVFVINGSLILSTATEKQRLGTSDSAWIEGSAKRQYACHGDTRARALIITFPKHS